MQFWRPTLVLATSAVFALAPIAGCGGAGSAYNPGGTLPPIRTTTTLPPSETTLAPYFEVYRLKAGENLGTVAHVYNVPIDVLIEFNRETLGENPSNLPIGTEIIIPPHRYVDTLPPTTSTTIPT